LAVLVSQPVPNGLRLEREDVESLYDPEVSDALGLIANEAVRHAFPDGNVVAVLGDKQAVYLGHQLAMGASSAATRGYIEVNLNHRIEQRDDWTVLTPGDPYMVSSRQTPRNELSRMLREARASKSVSIESMAQLTAATFAPSDAANLTLLALGLSFQSQSSDWSKLMFLGLLASAQRNALMQGRFIQVSSLSVSERKALEECVVKENLMRLVSRPGDAPQKLTGDATVLLPRGLPATTSISISVASEPSIVICYDNGYRVARAYQGNPTLVAWIEMGRYGELAEKRVGYLMGSQRTLAINIDFGEGASQTYQLSGLEPDIEGKPSPWTELPPKIVEQIRKAMGGE
jgi:hypothetical protein